MLILEAAVSLTILALMLAFIATMVSSYAKARDSYQWRLAALWAAEAQLQRYAAGAELESLPPPDLLPEEITLSTEVQEGAGDWEGLLLVTVTATVNREDEKPIVSTASCYVAPARKETAP